MVGMTDQSHSLSPALILAGLVVAATAAAGCGSDSKPTAHDQPAAAKNTSAVQSDLESFLMRNDEQPGFRRVERVVTDSGVTALAKHNGLTPADARQLRSDGFIAIAFQPIEGPDTRGVTNVHLFATAKGAKHWLEHEQRADLIHGFLPGASIRRFTVSGIPGAHGWAASDVGNVHWVQGRCLLVLGNQGPGPFAAPLSTGARAIYQRTRGQCP